jgi:hypothetical protein
MHLNTSYDSSRLGSQHSSLTLPSSAPFQTPQRQGLRVTPKTKRSLNLAIAALIKNELEKVGIAIDAMAQRRLETLLEKSYDRLNELPDALQLQENAKGFMLTGKGWQSLSFSLNQSTVQRFFAIEAARIRNASPLKRSLLESRGKEAQRGWNLLNRVPNPRPEPSVVVDDLIFVCPNGLFDVIDREYPPREEALVLPDLNALLSLKPHTQRRLAKKKPPIIQKRQPVRT